MPGNDWLVALAFRTLEDVLAQAEHGPVDRTWGHRLALRLLLERRISHEHEARTFWIAMNDPRTYSITGECLTRHSLDHIEALLDLWAQRCASSPPTNLRRHDWKTKYRGRIDSSIHDDMPMVMCNRAVRGETDKVLQLFGAKKVRDFNDGPLVIHPKSPGPVIRMERGEMVLDQMTWGFPVALKSKLDPRRKNKPKPVNNARFDKLGTFWKRWAAEPANRCLIPTARFAEAVGEPGHMKEVWITVNFQPIFAWAGLWDRSDEWGDVYTGVMTESQEDMAHIHDRAPVIIHPGQWMNWLTLPLAELYRFDHPPQCKLEVEFTDTPWYQPKEPLPGPLI